MPSADLRDILDGSGGPFRLESLREGRCPWTAAEMGRNDGEGGEDPPAIAIGWLPKRPPSLPSEWFRTRSDGGKSRARQPPVAVYYEHLSKAGGTSFCKLAQSNMPRIEVPDYCCMPSEPGMVDARVGSWSADKMGKYFSSKAHRLVSNEWEPFQEEFFRLQAESDLDLEEEKGERPLLLFVTSIRNPINRLLSAHKFWGILHKKSKDKPQLGTWLKRLSRRAGNWEILSKDFKANVGRFNFATWKFSGGSLPISFETQAEELLSNNEGGGGGDTAVPVLEEEVWLEPFRAAVRNLARFDLVIPMELLSDHPEPLTGLLGWTDFGKTHVVPSGKVVNNDASTELSKGQYVALWDANKLDILLYHWACAVYLTRMNCKI